MLDAAFIKAFDKQGLTLVVSPRQNCIDYAPREKWREALNSQLLMNAACLKSNFSSRRRARYSCFVTGGGWIFWVEGLQIKERGEAKWTMLTIRHIDSAKDHWNNDHDPEVRGNMMFVMHRDIITPVWAGGAADNHSNLARHHLPTS